MITETDIEVRNLSIRYTLRHNIPVDLIYIEKEKYQYNQDSGHVNKKPYDFNLLRKHELAEDTEHNIVFRTHDGNIVPISGFDVSVLEDYLKESDFNTAIAEYQKKLTYVDYFNTAGREEDENMRPKNVAFTTAFQYGQSIWDNAYSDDSSFLAIGKLHVPTYPTDTYRVEPSQSNSQVCFGKITKVVTKQDYDSNNYDSTDINFFTIPRTGKYKKLLSINTSQDYNSNVSSSPFRIVPYYVTHNGEQYIEGFYCIHDTSDTVTGYYTAVLGEIIQG